MKISCIMIVLNGMPFIEFSLRAIYDFAHKIVIVEGAVVNCMFAANPDGSSNDGTVDFIRSFPDPDNKITLIQGNWPEKCEMQNAALEYISSGYIWLVDSDEVYRKEEIQKLIQILEQDDSITKMCFWDYPFWKGFDYRMFCPGGAGHSGSFTYQRVLKYVPGATFSSHRPPTLLYPKGTIEKQNTVTTSQTSAKGIRFCHYSYVTEAQVYQKIQLYKRYGRGKSWHIDLDDWYNNCFLKWTPENRKVIDKKYAICPVNKNTYTVPFEGKHPEVILDYIKKFNGSK